MNLNNNPSSNNYPLIIECCRIDPDSEKLESLARTISDWDSVLSSAYAHGVYPLIAKSLKTINAVPDTIKSDLKQISIHIAQLNMQKSAELIRVVQALEEGGIRVLAIKGPVLSLMAHGNITDRQYSDLDIVVDQHNLYDAITALTTLGYLPERSIKFLRNEALMKVGKDFTVAHPNGVNIEVHWRLFLDKHAIDGNIQLFSEGSPRYAVHAHEVMTLEFMTSLLYLLLHGSNHFWERLEWIVDIDRLVRLHHNTIVWETLSNRAERMEIDELIYLGLAVAQRVFDTPIDSTIHEIITTNDRIISAVDRIVEQIYHDEIKKEEDHLISLDTMKKMGMLRDRHNRWLRQYLKTLFHINELDIYEINLPSSLYVLYYPIRLWRLLKLNILRMQPKR